MKLFINKEIANVSDMQRWVFGIDSVSFSDIKSTLDYIKEWYPTDNNIDVEIHSCGGDTTEGYAIYDALRTCGKELSCTVVGVAASMATVILLAAPKERRYAYEHAQMLIHSPYFPANSSREELTIDTLDALKGKLEEERGKMLKLYAERTGTDEATLSAQMSDGGWFDANKAIELGFIASIIPPTSASAKIENFSTTTNSIPQMKFKKEGAMASAFLSLGKALGLIDDESPVSMELTTESGETLTIEREEGDPQVGDKASPDGEHKLDDGRIIVVEDGAITEIKTEEETTDEDDDTEALKAKVAELEAKLKDAEDKATSAEAKVAEQMAAMAKLSSTFVPNGRQNVPGAKGGNADEPKKSKVQERLEKARAAANK